MTEIDYSPVAEAVPAGVGSRRRHRVTRRHHSRLQRHRRAAQGGTFNWMTWGDHYIDTQLKAIEASDKITANISELAGNAEGFAKLKEVKGQLDMISGDALWVPDAYNKEGLIEPFDINELKVASQLYPFAREFEIWTTPEGYLGYPFGWSPISIYYNPQVRRAPPPTHGRCCSTPSTRAGSSSRSSPRRSSPTWPGLRASTSRTT